MGRNRGKKTSRAIRTMPMFDSQATARKPTSMCRKSGQKRG